MRIYLDKLWLNIDLNKISSMLTQSDNVIYLYSFEGIYVIQNNKVMEVEINDGEINKINDYIDDISITIDTTIINKLKHTVSQIPNNHIKIIKNIKYYRLREKSPLSFVIEFIDDEICDFYFILEGYHAKYSNADLNNSSIKEDFKDFFNIIYEK